ncbi:MAG: YczE/YyaS/YitT family protein [Yaniella sp.]|uniref:YczE/YyaS/YitT family protein n=1 Tax=Yaniella sp. TaxID=2773929 RepID=UPI003F96C71D
MPEDKPRDVVDDGTGTTTLTSQVPKLGCITRWATFLLGVFVMSVGIALSVHGQLGTAPISTFPAVVDAASSWSVGTVSAVMNVVFVFMQMLILRRRFRLFQLVQLPIALVFGAVIDLSLCLTSWAQVDHYLLQWVVTIIGALILGLGVYIQIQPKLLYLPGEGLVVALTQVSTVRFGTMKQVVDWSLVVISAVLSLVLMQRLEGVREGTVFAAFAVGGVVKTLDSLNQRRRKSYTSDR